MQTVTSSTIAILENAGVSPTKTMRLIRQAATRLQDGREFDVYVLCHDAGNIAYFDDLAELAQSINSADYRAARASLYEARESIRRSGDGLSLSLLTSHTHYDAPEELLV